MAGEIAGSLSFFLQRSVLDKTGLLGRYDVELEWTPESRPQSASSDAPPSIFTAVQQQLGLKLEPAKGPVEMLVIDHVESSSEN